MAVFRGFQALRPTSEKASRVASLPYDVVSREEAYALGKANPDSFLHVERAEIDCPKERPTSEKASRVASLPYDVVSREEAYALGKANPDSFLHVERAEIDCPKETDMYDECVYRKAEENLQKMIEEGTLIEEEKRCFYIYELIRKGKSQTGFVGCSSIDDYQSGVIRRHELTRTEKERDRIRHMEVCCANTSPVFLTCRYTEKLKMLLESWKQTHRPVYDFTAEDEITHRVWIVDEAEEIKMAEEEFGKIPSLYIADGHHRAASAVKTGLKYREENPDYTGEEEFNYFLSVVFPCEQLTILPYLLSFGCISMRAAYNSSLSPYCDRFKRNYRKSLYRQLEI